MLNTLFHSLYLGEQEPSNMYMQIQPQIISGKVPIFTLSYLDSPTPQVLVQKITNLAQEYINVEEIDLGNKTLLEKNILAFYSQIGKYRLLDSMLWKPEIVKSRLLNQFGKLNSDYEFEPTPYCEVMYGIIEPSELIEFAINENNGISLRDYLTTNGDSEDDDDIELEFSFSTQLTKQKTLNKKPTIQLKTLKVEESYYDSKSQEIINWLLSNLNGINLEKLLPNISETREANYINDFLKSQFSENRTLKFPTSISIEEDLPEFKTNTFYVN